MQTDRQRRGNEFEAQLLRELQAHGWARRWPRAYAGQPFDISAMIDGVAYGIECKRIASGNLPYSCFTGNELRELSQFEDSGGVAVVAVYRDEPYTVRYLPWYAIRDPILGGERGGIVITSFPDTLAGVQEVSRP